LLLFAIDILVDQGLATKPILTFQSVKYPLAYCGSGYSKRSLFSVQGEWEWMHFQEFLGGSKLRNEKNDLFRHLMVRMTIECLRPLHSG
jgi:hypothetical protein